MEHIWSVLCRSQITDKDRNTLSLIETVEQINFFSEENNIDGIPAQFVLVSMWWRSNREQPEVGYQRMCITSPTGEIMVATSNLKIDLETSGRARIIINVDGFPYAGDGIYRFLVQYSVGEGDNLVNAASIPLLVIRDTVSRLTNET